MYYIVNKVSHLIKKKTVLDTSPMVTMSLLKSVRRTKRQTERQTNRQTERQTDRHTNRRTDRQKDKQTDRKTNRQTDKHSKAFSQFGSGTFFGKLVDFLKSKNTRIGEAKSEC